MILLISEKLSSPNTASNFSPIILTLACVSICCMNLSVQLPSSLHQTGKENMYAYRKQSISSPSKLPPPLHQTGKENMYAYWKQSISSSSNIAMRHTRDSIQSPYLKHKSNSTSMCRQLPNQKPHHLIVPLTLGKNKNKFS